MGDRTFASEYEGVILDMLILDKGLTRRYLPLAITLISEKLSSGHSMGLLSEGRALACGRSYSGNATGEEKCRKSYGLISFSLARAYS